MSIGTVPEILRICQSLGWKITTAESCTGGLLAATLTEVAGASAVFDRGFVTYSNDAKMDLLNVQKSTLHKFGAVSEQVALEMALGALRASGADLAVAITGIAGPGGSDAKPEGRVCFALAGGAKPPFAQTLEFGAVGRAKVRELAVRTALEMIEGAAITNARQNGGESTRPN